jgi:hypothetical protein
MLRFGNFALKKIHHAKFCPYFHLAQMVQSLVSMLIYATSESSSDFMIDNEDITNCRGQLLIPHWPAHLWNTLYLCNIPKPVRKLDLKLFSHTYSHT